MQANMFKTDTPFRVGDEYYIIQAVHPGKTDTELFCKPYDQETGKPKNTRNAPIFSASELKRMIFNEQACFLDPRSHRHTSMSLTDKQLQQQQMWLDFNYFHIERCGGTRLQANDLVDESIELFNLLTLHAEQTPSSSIFIYFAPFLLKVCLNSLIEYGFWFDMTHSLQKDTF